MFKSGRWKNQNSKIKVMFQLQFQATQVPKLKGKGVMIALIPAETGKPIARLERAPVVDGTCTWADPIYEMVKLVKNPKTETYKEKIYYFNVQTGSSKSGFVGEVGVDFATFVESTEPFQLSLPLTTSDSGAILHVFIQKMQRTDDMREFEENESPQSESVRSKSENGNIHDFAEDVYLQRVDSENSKDSKSENNPNFQEQATVKKKSKPPNKKVDKRRSSNDWSLGSLSDRSMADLLNSPEQNYSEASKNAAEVLKSDMSRLERQAELSELELESLRKQILKENKRGQDLCRKIDELREEKEALEIECDQLKSSQIRNYNAVSNPLESPENLKLLLDEIKEELKKEKSLNKALTLNLRNTEKSNAELLLAAEDFDRKVEEKNIEIEGLCAEVELERKEKEELKIHIEDVSLDYKFLLQENDDMSAKLEEAKMEQMNIQSEYSKSLTTIKQYELQVKRLEEKIVNQAMELSQSLDTITEFETHIKRLEKELEKQGHDFEDDVEDLMKAKIEQEERVIQAEEALRESKLTNATAVKNLQEELKRLSVEMTSNVNERDKMASEVQNLQQQISDLQEALDKSRQQLSLTKDTYKQEVHELCDQLDRQAEQIKEMSLNLEISKKHGESKEGTTQEWIRERELLVTEFASLKKETEKLQKESTSWTSLMSEKNVMIRALQSELKMIRGDYNELKQKLVVIESEKVNLQKEVSMLKQKNLNLIKEIKVASEASSKHDESRSILGSAKSNEGRCSEKYNDEQKLNKLLSEVSSLDKRNKHMESELKEMQDKYSEVSLRFAEVEGERQQLVMALRNLRNGKK